MKWRVKADESDGFIGRIPVLAQTSSAARDCPRAHFLLILACKHAVKRTDGSLQDSTGDDSFQLFSNHSSTSNIDQAALRMDSHLPDDELALSARD
jgi:hypothetical protein